MVNDPANWWADKLSPRLSSGKIARQEVYVHGTQYAKRWAAQIN